MPSGQQQKMQTKTLDSWPVTQAIGTMMGIVFGLFSSAMLTTKLNKGVHHPVDCWSALPGVVSRAPPRPAPPHRVPESAACPANGAPFLTTHERYICFRRCHLRRPPASSPDTDRSATQVASARDHRESNKSPTFASPF